MNNIYINIDNMWLDVPEELIIFQGSSIWNRQPWLGAWRVRTVAWQEIHGSMGYLSCSSCSCTDHSKLKYNSKMMQNGFGSFGTFTKSSWNGLLSYDSYGILRARSKTSTWHRDTPGDLRWRRRIWQVCGRPYAAGQKMARLGPAGLGQLSCFFSSTFCLGQIHLFDLFSTSTESLALDMKFLWTDPILNRSFMVSKCFKRGIGVWGKERN